VIKLNIGHALDIAFPAAAGGGAAAAAGAAAVHRTETDPFTGDKLSDAPLLTLLPEVGIAARVSAC
jgi:hypothetical protein